MCGIIGYIGNKTIDKTLVNLLQTLEYRGYDSAGVAVLNNDKIETTKAVGKIENLSKILTGKIANSCGIAHTRWATHGRASYENTHPHLSQDKSWAVVHNGIIENYAEIKKDLQKQDITFSSDTDTEVISNLLQTQNTNDIYALINACKNLKGSYALACINKHKNNTLFLARNKSPLYVCKNKNEVFVASDISCFVGNATEYYTLLDGEFCTATTKSIDFFNKNQQKIEKIPSKLDNFMLSNSKNNYTHYMLKEIEETPEVISRIEKVYGENRLLNVFNKKFISKYNNVVLIGCGTAYHASLVGAKYLQDIARISANAYVASEFRYSNPIISHKTLCIFVSQSGETADTLACVNLAKEKGATCVALTNVLYSSLAKNTSIVLPVCAGPEIAVASTKAYSAQITIFYMLASHLKNVLFNKRINYLSHIKALSKKMLTSYPMANNLALELKNQEKAFFIGRHLDYLSCEEASLKLKEISYINSSAHPAGELKHGFLALIENGTYVFVLASSYELLDKTLNGANEAFARGGKIILISNLKIKKEKYKDFYALVKLPSASKHLMPIISITFFQLLAYYSSLARSLNPDQPRNLAKSVTVE